MARLPRERATQLLQNFGTVGSPRVTQPLLVGPGATVTLDLQWGSTFASIGGNGSANSLGIYVYDVHNRLVASAAQNVQSGDPDQAVTFTNPGGHAAMYRVAIADTAGPAPGLLKYIVYGNARIDDPQAGRGSGTVIGHEMVSGVNTVGAVPWRDTPRFGANLATPEPFSSFGPGELLFDRSGQRLPAPQFLSKVDFDAPDGSATSVFSPFYGTSAAAPAAAAVAALMLQADPTLTPPEIS
jgi:hypothetical protein